MILSLSLCGTLKILEKGRTKHNNQGNPGKGTGKDIKNIRKARIGGSSWFPPLSSGSLPLIEDKEEAGGDDTLGSKSCCGEEKEDSSMDTLAREVC